VVCGLSIGEGPSLLRRDADTPSAAQELATTLTGHLGVPVVVDDMGRALTLAEGWVGAAKGTPNFATIRIDEVVSGGIVLDGRLLDGGLGGAGRIGHVIVRPDGRRCRCGARGCLEAEVSVSSIESWTGRPLTEPGYDHMRQVGQLVGRAASVMANLLDLRLIVCGGRVAREYASTMFLAAQDELDSSCQLSFSRGARIVSAKTPEPSGLVGAAALGWRGLARER
jgi:glucokinase